MDEIKVLAEDIRRVRTKAASELTIEQRLDTGPLMFRQWKELVRSDVLADDPNATDADVHAEVQRRLKIARWRDSVDRDGEPIYRELKA